MLTSKTQNNNLERAYEELEKEILDIKSKLQKSLGNSGVNHNSSSESGNRLNAAEVN